MENSFKNRYNGKALCIKKRSNITYENKKVSKEKISDLFLYFAFFILSLNFLGYRAYNLEPIKNYLRIVAFLLLILTMVFKGRKYKFASKELFIIWCMGLILLFNGINSLNFFFIVIISIITKNVYIGELSRKFNKINLSLFLLLIGSLVTGVLHNMQYVSSMGRVRTTLGFNNPNAASQFLFSVVVIFVLSNQRHYAKRLLIGFGGSIYFYLYTNSRTTLAAFFLFTIFYFLFKRLFKFKRITIIYYTVILSVILLICSTFLASYLLELFPQLDQFTSYRLTIFSEYIEANTISNLFFGGTLVPEVDNFYLVFLYTYGILIFIFASTIILKAVRNLLYERNQAYLAFVLTMMFIALTESSIIRPELLSVMLFWKIIFQYGFIQKSKIDVNKEVIYEKTNK